MATNPQPSTGASFHTGAQAEPKVELDIWELVKLIGMLPLQLTTREKGLHEKLHGLLNIANAGVSGAADGSALKESLAKPPLGVMPRIIWLQKRADEIVRAIHEYMRDGRYGPVESWLRELLLLVCEIKDESTTAFLHEDEPQSQKFIGTKKEQDAWAEYDLAKDEPVCQEEA